MLVACPEPEPVAWVQAGVQVQARGQLWALLLQVAGQDLDRSYPPVAERAALAAGQAVQAGPGQVQEPEQSHAAGRQETVNTSASHLVGEALGER